MLLLFIKFSLDVILFQIQIDYNAIMLTMII